MLPPRLRMLALWASAHGFLFSLFRLVSLFALLGVLVTPAAADGECSATNPCATGCCSKYGNCGLGPDYCAPANCIASCNSKSECDPGGWGQAYANSTACPLNVCCSAYGFCGTTPEFCGTSTVSEPSCDVASTGIGRVVGYYESWSGSRSCNAMYPGRIPQGVYTHINFAFASIDPVSFNVVPSAASDESLYPLMQALKTRDLGLQTWIAIGGWTFNDDDQPTKTTFSDLAASPASQDAFFASLLQFMQTWGFTGVDIDWEYPEAPDRNGRGEDFTNFPVFLQRLRGALDPYGFGLSVTLPSSFWYLQHFNLPKLEPWVDWFNIMEYDLHGAWDIGNQWTGAFLNAHTNLTEIRDSLDLLWRNHVDPAKVNLGLAMYGRSTTLASAACTAPGCPYLSGGNPGMCSGQTGILLNSEIESIIATYGLQPTLYEDAAVKTISWGNNQWVSFDDVDTWKIKGDYAKSQCLGGVMVWAISHDDDAGTYANQLAAGLGRAVLIDSATNATGVAVDTFSQASMCQWSNCGVGCPAGFAEVPLSNAPGQSLTDATGCFGAGHVHTFCCPKTAAQPTCALRGFQDSGVCVPGCATGEAEVGTQATGCSSGYKSACCTTDTPATAPYGECAWFGTPPLCSAPFTDAAACPADYPNLVVSSSSGQGGAGTCWVGAMSYCCEGVANTAPRAFQECSWNSKASHAVSGTAASSAAVCEDSCPAGQLLVARQQGGCALGTEAYCCKGAPVTGLGNILLYTGDTSPEFLIEEMGFYQTYTDDELLLFLAEFYNHDGVCPDDLEENYDWSPYGTVSGDGGSQGVTSSSSLKKARDVVEDGLSAKQFQIAISTLAILFSSPYPQEALADIWNSFQEIHRIGFNQVRELLLTVTGGPLVFNPEWVTSWMLCESDIALDNLDDLESAANDLCEIPGGGRNDMYGSDGQNDIDGAVARRAPPSAGTDHGDRGERLEKLAARYIFRGSKAAAYSKDKLFSRPTVLMVLNEITLGTIVPIYYRWIQINPPDDIRGIETEVDLEIAYSSPGSRIVNGGGYLPTRLQDTRNGNRDQWIVFHLHMPVVGDGVTPLVATNNFAQPGRVNWHPGFRILSMYHGQEVRPAAMVYPGEGPPQNQVVWRNTRGSFPLNGRVPAVACSGTNVWYIGHNRTDEPTVKDNEFARAMLSWGNNLYSTGIFAAGGRGTPGLNLLFPNLMDTVPVAPNYAPVPNAFNINWGGSSGLSSG